MEKTGSHRRKSRAELTQVYDVPSEGSARRVGRPVEFSCRQYFALWLFVQEGIARTGQSVRKFCDRNSFGWVTVGGAGGPYRTKFVTGLTLRRRYEAAVEFIRNADASYWKLRKVGTSRLLEKPPPTLAWLQRELDQRLRGRWLLRKMAFKS